LSGIFFTWSSGWKRKKKQTQDLGLSLAPAPEVIRIQGNTKEVGRNKTELCRAQTDEANNYAVGASDYPALPQFSSHQQSGNHRQDAGDVIEPQHVIDPRRRIFTNRDRTSRNEPQARK
jgi:hypothetical protein